MLRFTSQWRRYLSSGKCNDKRTKYTSTEWRAWHTHKMDPVAVKSHPAVASAATAGSGRRAAQNRMSPTDSVGSFSSGTESGLTKKCPRGPDSLRSAAAAADDVVVTQDIPLLAVRPLAGLVCEPISVLLALRRSSISCRRRSRPARSIATSGILAPLLVEWRSGPNRWAIESVRLISSGSVPRTLSCRGCLRLPSTARSGPTIGPTRYPFIPGTWELRILVRRSDETGTRRCVRPEPTRLSGSQRSGHGQCD